MMDDSHSMTMGQCPFDFSSLTTNQTLSNLNDDLVAEKTKSVDFFWGDGSETVSGRRSEYHPEASKSWQWPAGWGFQHCEKIRWCLRRIVQDVPGWLLEATKWIIRSSEEEQEISEKSLESAEYIDALSGVRNF